jgi:hypothetical protein
MGKLLCMGLFLDFSDHPVDTAPTCACPFVDPDMLYGHALFAARPVSLQGFHLHGKGPGELICGTTFCTSSDILGRRF